ncbi:hypothetical protein OIU78_012644 [Salix suchowensis]|nr:hypothetical protein OIU78_012644 [Salix suchowensis]
MLQMNYFEKKFRCLIVLWSFLPAKNLKKSLIHGRKINNISLGETSKYLRIPYWSLRIGLASIG